jgi:hypothetical protein
MNAISGAVCAGLAAMAMVGSVQAASGASAGGLSLTWLRGSEDIGANVTGAVSGLDWSCAAIDCTLASAPRIDFVFGAGPSGTRALAEENATFMFQVTRAADVTVTDPLGQAHKLLPFLGQWSFGVDVLSNQAPAGAQINTAHGRFDGEVGFGKAWSWKPDRFPQDKVAKSTILEEGKLVVAQSTLVSSGQTGSLLLGPGSGGEQTLVPVGEAWLWELGTRTFSPFYASPSVTDPRCASLSCMVMTPGVLLTGGYRFSVAAGLAPAVPEPSMVALSALGLAVGALLVRGRRRAA